MREEKEGEVGGKENNGKKNESKLPGISGLLGLGLGLVRVWVRVGAIKRINLQA
jgi:hypothetical protein